MRFDNQGAAADVEATLLERVDLAYLRARRDVYDVARDLSFRLSPQQSRRVAEHEASEAALRDWRQRRRHSVPEQRFA